ncbi:MAG: hypothetical protein WCP96_06930 [Methylococcaceae bacterium]
MKRQPLKKTGSGSGWRIVTDRIVRSVSGKRYNGHLQITRHDSI